MWQSLTETIVKLFGEHNRFGVKHETEVNNYKRVSDAVSLKNILPYESFDPKTSLFYNRKSVGAVLKLSPLTGATEETLDILVSILTDVLPVDIDMHFLLAGSDKIGPIVDDFVGRRAQGEHIYSWLSNKRKQFLLDGAHQSLSQTGHYVLRDISLYCCLSITGGSNDVEKLIQFRTELCASLKSIQIHSIDLSASELINLIQDWLCPSFDVYPSHYQWNRFDSLASQMIDAECQLVVSPDKLDIVRCDDSLSICALSVRQYPKQAALWQASENLGQLFNTALQIPCPFLVSFQLKVLDKEKASAKAQMKFMQKDSTAKSPLAKFNPIISKEHRDWQLVRDRLSENDALVQCHYQIVLYAKSEELNFCERKVRDLYRANQWILKKERYVQLPSLLGVLPMMMSEGYFHDAMVFGRVRTMTAYSAINLSPLIGEWKGVGSAKLMLPTRRGQCALWNPFECEGNYNVAIAAASGQGKSTLTQEYIIAQLGSCGRVWVIDVGRSYQKTCQLLGGQFIEFKPSHPISMNPFTHIKDFNESLSLLKPLIALMARPASATSDEENSYIEKAIKAAWDEKHNNATISTVAAWLSAQPTDEAKKIAHLLYPFTKDGMYGAYFDGPSTLDLNNPFIVLELEELKSKRDLQTIILFVLMYQISECMYLGDRRQEKSCVIDEAWDLLGEGNESAAKFIETGYRRARRYNANFVTITQSINDYFKNPASIAIYENSDWNLILGQKDESISQLKESKRLIVDDYLERCLRSLRKTEDYSECVIKGPHGVSVHRIVLDAYSRILFSSKGDEFTMVNDLLEQGIELTDAVEKVAKLKFSGNKPREKTISAEVL